MAAGLGFKTFTTGEVLTAADTNGYLMQGVLVFASSAARAAAITSPQEGQYSYLKDTNSTEYYDGAAWIAAPIGDITGVTAGTGITGGGTSGTVTITNDMATTITAAGDIVVGTGSGTYDNLPIGTTGQVLTADTTVSPYKVKWATAASGASFAGVACTTNANQSIGDSAYVVLNFNQEYLDVGGYHDTATNNSRLTVPSGKAGYYQAYFNINFAGNATNGAAGRRAFIMLNGSVAALVNNQSDVSTTLIKGLTASRTFNLAVGDYLEVAVYQTSGGALNVLGGDAYCTFGMFYLGA